MAAAPVSAPSPKFVNTWLNYYLEIADGGTDKIYPGTAGDKLRKHNPQPARIYDMRGSGEDFNLDTAGFQLVQHVSQEKTFEDEEAIKDSVYEECRQLLKKVTGASSVHPFSHIIRRQTWDAAVRAARQASNPKEVVKMLNAANYCHVDQSYDGAVEALRDNPAPGLPDMPNCRWGIINLWRPIGRPVPREPLAVADARSVPESDLRPVRAGLPAKNTGTFDRISKGDGFEIWNLAANPEHKWYYASQMTPEEVLMIKCFDSKRDGRARRCPHTAFQIEGQDESAPARESIEVRCFVFWEDDTAE